MLETIQRESSISFPMLGDFSINPPAYFTLFGRPIYFYGVLIGIGFLLGINLCAKRAKRFGLKEDDVYDVMLWLIPSSILGARLYYVIFNWAAFADAPVSALYIWQGGLAIYGGIAGILVVVLLCRHKRVPIGAMLDDIVYGLLLGQIIGRWGNFMNREAFGRETTIFCRMGLTAPDGTTIYVHPTFLYESLWNLVGLIALIIWERKGGRRYDGQAALGYFFWYGVGRTWIEGLRTDSLYIAGTSLRVSQLLSIVLALVSLVLLVVNARRKHPPEELYVNKVAAAAAEIVQTEKGEETEHE